MGIILVKIKKLEVEHFMHQNVEFTMIFSYDLQVKNQQWKLIL